MKISKYFILFFSMTILTYRNSSGFDSNDQSHRERKYNIFSINKYISLCLHWSFYYFNIQALWLNSMFYSFAQNTNYDSIHKTMKHFLLKQQNGLKNRTKSIMKQIYLNFFSFFFNFF